jgi:hypothetical protein
MQNRIHAAPSAASVVGPIATRVSVAAVVATTLASTFISTASADFTTRHWGSDTNYELRISHMPDFDQRRIGLPEGSGGSPGGMYCAPTSGSNLFAYIASHGYSIDPGVADWEDPDYHHFITAFIEQMGDVMLTSATGGTAGPTAYPGFTAYLLSESTAFRVEMEMWSPWNSVSLKELARAGIDDQAISFFAYGRYKEKGVNLCGEKVVWRDGGHFMTFVGAERDGSTRTISYNDPVDSGDSDTQSDMDDVDVVDRNSPWIEDLVVSPIVAGSCALPKQAMSRIGNASGDTHKFIDFRMTVRPRSSYSWGAYSGLLGGGLAIQSTSATYTPGELAQREARTPSIDQANQSRTSITIAPSGVPFLVVPGPSGGLFTEVRSVNGAMLVPVDLSDLQLPPIDEAVFSGDRTLVVRAGRMLYAIAGLDDGITLEDGEKPTVVWSTEVPFTVAKLVARFGGQSTHMHGMAHSVLAFSPDLRVAFEIDGDPESQPRMVQIPGSLPLDAELSDLSDTTIVDDPFGGLWFAQKGANQIAALLPNGNVIVQPLPVESIHGLAIDDRGAFLVVDGDRVRCFMPSPKGLVERGTQGSIFAGQRVGRGFTVARSTSNFEPRFHSHDGWREVPEPAARPGDLDGDGMVGPQDLAVVLGAWGSGQGQGGAADINGDGVVGAEDLAALLANWGS